MGRTSYLLYSTIAQSGAGRQRITSSGIRDSDISLVGRPDEDRVTSDSDEDGDGHSKGGIAASVDGGEVAGVILGWQRWPYQGRPASPPPEQSPHLPFRRLLGLVPLWAQRRAIAKMLPP